MEKTFKGVVAVVIIVILLSAGGEVMRWYDRRHPVAKQVPAYAFELRSPGKTLVWQDSTGMVHVVVDYTKADEARAAREAVR